VLIDLLLYWMASAVYALRDLMPATMLFDATESISAAIGWLEDQAAALGAITSVVPIGGILVMWGVFVYAWLAFVLAATVLRFVLKAALGSRLPG